MSGPADIAKPVTESLCKARILIAEDDKLSQLVTSQMLENAGYKADVVADGHAVIKTLESVHYDAIVMDCSMPGMDGFATTKAIRAVGSQVCNRAIPIIALTAMAMRGDRERCLAAGMNEYLSKPVDSGELLETVQKCLALSRGTQFVETRETGKPPTIHAKEYAEHSEVSWDPEIFDKVLGLFFKEIEHHVAALRAAINEGNYDILLEVSHQLRGSAALIDAHPLSDKAFALYKIIRSGDFSRAAEHTENLINELESFSSTQA